MAKRHIIHVAQDAIRANVKDGGDRPPIIDNTYQGSRRGYEAALVINGEVVGKVVNRMQDPNACGARVWIEWYHEVELVTLEPRAVEVDLDGLPRSRRARRLQESRDRVRSRVHRHWYLSM